MVDYLSFLYFYLFVLFLFILTTFCSYFFRFISLLDPLTNVRKLLYTVTSSEPFMQGGPTGDCLSKRCD